MRRPRPDVRYPASLLLIALLGLSAAGSRAAPAVDEPEEPLPGLYASFSPVGRAAPRSFQVVEDLGGNWAGAAPDPRVPIDGFEGRWIGSLLIQSPGLHRFRARTDGTVVLRVGGKPVVEGKGPECVGEPVELPAGLVDLSLEYRHSEGHARVAIDWEGPGFAREPLPSRLLFREAEPTGPIDRFDEGRRLADRLGCANCHALLDLAARPNLGPSLRDAGDAIEAHWLDVWLQDPPKVRPSTRMPADGPGLSPQEAADVRAFLRRAGGKTPPPSNEVKMALNVASPSRGRLLFRSVGCLGCHGLGDPPDRTAGASDLADLGLKRGATWLALFLEHPKQGKVPSRHRPDLRLSADEAADLAAYFTSESPPRDERPPPEGNPDRGRALAERARCASCHEVPGLAPVPRRIPLTDATRADAGCLADSPGAGVSRFRLDDADRRALREFVAGLPPRSSPLSASTKAEDLIRRLNCLGCHARDGRGGIELGMRVTWKLSEDPALGALKGTLTPPNLTAAGDKLRPEYLASAVCGQAPIARPWLSVRMPVFAFEDGEAEALVAYFRQHDQMSAEDDSAAPPPKPDPGDVEWGSLLIGQRGFGCVSCHVLAGRIPPGGEPETLGPDLALAHRRMTKRYFDRWLANPQRIIPGTPMPQFVQPVASQRGPLAAQLESIWSLLGSPRLASLAASGTREILKRQGDRAMVVRDMVLLPGAPGTSYTPRGLAIGLKNDHSLLFDTDRLTWLAWWKGGFVSRTKSGRLWEWHPEGKPVWTAPDRLAPVVFIDSRGSIVPPREERERFGSFLEILFEGDGVVLTYRLNGPGDAPIQVDDRIRPIDGGWERDVRVSGDLGDSKPALTIPDARSSKGSNSAIRIEVEGGTEILESEGRRASFALMSPASAKSFQLRCRCRVASE